MCRVEIEEVDGKLKVSSPYSPDLPKLARNLGGKWSGAAWVFDSRLKEDVAKVYRSVYGEWPGDEQDYVTVRATALIDTYEDKGGIFLFGRCLARAYGRDSGARLGEGVILREGRFTSGGSMKNWITKVLAGTVVEVMDVPRQSVDAGDYDPDIWKVEILEQAAPTIDREALEAEKERLLARITQIDELLAEN